MELGQVGVWFFTDTQSAEDAATFAQRIESLGYAALWIPEAVGRHPFAHAAWLLAKTSRLVVATGIASIYNRDPGATVAAANTLAEQSNNRFILGLGVSHQPMVEGVRGHAYGKPVTTMRTYLESMDKAIYRAIMPSSPAPIVLAALGPNMLALAGTAAGGAHPYFTTPAHTRKAREIMGAGPLLCVEQKVILNSDPGVARAAARGAAGMYAQLPNYRNNWLRLGFSEEDINGLSDAFIDATFAWGDAAQIRARIDEHLAAGASHVCIQPIAPSNPGFPDMAALEALAPAG